MRLVDADALMENAQVYEVECGDEIGDDVREIKAVIVSRIENAPTIYPVKHGRWIFGDCGWKCSLCDHSMPYWPMASTQEVTHYCPNCGARKDGEA